jgi:predicted ATPase
MRRGLAAYRVTGAELWSPYFLALLAEAHGKGGQADEGLRVLAEALELVDKTAERWWEAELHRLEGELSLIQDAANLREAEHCFRTAIEVARRQGGKSLELRATTSAARLLAKQGRRDEACAMLAEIHGWFTEGFDTRDLKDAKALLDELNG